MRTMRIRDASITVRDHVVKKKQRGCSPSPREGIPEKEVLHEQQKE
jgi:hypothetical protein